MVDQVTNLKLVQPGCVPGNNEPELLLGNQFAENIRASSTMLHQQAGYMDASDLCKLHPNLLLPIGARPYMAYRFTAES
jgi:hypothetical protein